MRDAFQTIWANPYVRVFVGLLVAGVLVWLFLVTQPAGTLFLASLGLAYLINPLVEFMLRHGVRRPFTVALIALVMAVGTWFVTQYTVRTIGAIVTEGEEGITLADTVPEFLMSLPERIEELLPEGLRGTAQQPLDALDTSIGRLEDLVGPYFEELTVTTYAFLTGTVAQVFNAVLVLILTVYVLIDFERISMSMRRIVPRPYRRQVRSLAATLDEVTGAYVRGQLIIAALVGVMVFVGLSLIGLPGAGVIALFAGLLNIVPFIGTIAPIIPAVLIAIGGGWLQVILVLLVFFIANQIDSHALTPLILSRSTELHPVTVILAVIAGFSVGGIFVAILAVPAVAFLKALYEEYYTKTDFYRDG